MSFESMDVCSAASLMAFQHAGLEPLLGQGSCTLITADKPYMVCQLALRIGSIAKAQLSNTP